MTRESSLVVFDLDGTLTRRDTYLLYLMGFRARHPCGIVRLLHLPWVVGMFYLGIFDNAQLKERFLRAFLRGARRAALHQWTTVFVDKLMSRGMCWEALAVLEKHRQNGDVLVLLSASLDIYVEALGDRLGFNHVICTRAHWEGDRLSGELLGLNCHGDEKVHRLEELRRRYRGMKLIAYADHHSDIPLLRLADSGILVNGTRKAQYLAAQAGIDCHVW
jgi:phosphatidylglycerophosphatase C